MKEQENLTGKGITAAVLDTGIFPHMDFDGRIVAFRDLVYGRETPYDDNGHGTHVCGILGGSGRASGGKYQGAAPGCRFVVVKILDRRGNGRKQDILWNTPDILTEPDLLLWYRQKESVRIWRMIRRILHSGLTE